MEKHANINENVKEDTIFKTMNELKIEIQRLKEENELLRHQLQPPKDISKLVVTDDVNKNSKIITDTTRQPNRVAVSTVNEVVDAMEQWRNEKIQSSINNIECNLSNRQHQQLPPQQELPIEKNKYLNHSLSCNDIERYSRQILLGQQSIIGGIHGQEKIQQTSVLVIGAGGIGSTVLMYLASAGIGCLGILDYDIVDRSNLHRQIIHNDTRVGKSKVESARDTISALNPTITCISINTMLSYANCSTIIQQFDIIVDASDNPMTRYLINDACVLLDKVLVSGSAIGTDGQMTVYNYLIPTTTIDAQKGNQNVEQNTTIATPNKQQRGPCYRCMYPNPKVSSNCTSCSDSGVLGPVPGLIGILQSIEVFKIISLSKNVLYDKMIHYDATTCSFYTIKKPFKNSNCPVCSSTDNSSKNKNNNKSICNNPTQVSSTTAPIRSMNDSFINLVEAESRGPQIHKVCSPVTNDSNDSIQYNTISCTAYKETILGKNIPHVLLDVRIPDQYAMCSLPNAISMPLNDITKSKISNICNQFSTVHKSTNDDDTKINHILPIFCICRRGIASKLAVAAIKEIDQTLNVYNINGGLNAWHSTVDASFPHY